MTGEHHRFLCVDDDPAAAPVPRILGAAPQKTRAVFITILFFLLLSPGILSFLFIFLL